MLKNNCINWIGKVKWYENGKWDWQNKTCGFSRYFGNDVSELITNKSMLFLGNSIIRRHMYTIAHLALGGENMPPKPNANIHDLIFDRQEHNNIIVILDITNKKFITTSLSKCGCKMNTYTTYFSKNTQDNIVVQNDQCLIAHAYVPNVNIYKLNSFMRKKGMGRVISSNSQPIILQYWSKKMTMKWANDSSMNSLKFFTSSLQPYINNTVFWTMKEAETTYHKKSLKCKRTSFPYFVKKITEKISRWAVLSYAWSWTNTEDYQIASLCKYWNERTIGSNADIIFTMGSVNFAHYLSRVRSKYNCFSSFNKKQPIVVRTPIRNNRLTNYTPSNNVYNIDFVSALLEGEKFSKYNNFSWYESAKIHQTDSGRLFMINFLLNTANILIKN